MSTTEFGSRNMGAIQEMLSFPKTKYFLAIAAVVMLGAGAIGYFSDSGPVSDDFLNNNPGFDPRTE